MNKYLSGSPLYGLLWLLLLIACLGIFIPSYLFMPVDGLEASWVFAINQAVAQGLAFGRELIFTFGPYAAMYTRQYHPATDFMVMSASVYLALSYWGYCFVLMRGEKKRWIFAFCIFLLGGMYAREALLYSVPLLAGLASFKLLQQQAHADHRRPYLYALSVILIFTPLGLLPLIKGSILILCGIVTMLTAIFFIAHRAMLPAALCIITTVTSTVVFWMIAGQQVADLPAYFIHMIPVVSGYTEAMALKGKQSEIHFYLVASFLVSVSILTNPALHRVSKGFLTALFLAFLFIAFKSGFVRHDAHAVTAATAILTAALLLPFIRCSKITFLTICVSCAAWLTIVNHHTQGWLNESQAHFDFNYGSIAHAFKQRLSGENSLRAEFDIALGELRKKGSLPAMPGTADIYSSGQAYLIASDNRWAPRPILQSYSVYTPALAEHNRAHLLGDTAPDNIVFSIEPIDGKFPALEDGASWPILLSRYTPVSLRKNFLFLQHKNSLSPDEPAVHQITQTHAFGDTVAVPASSHPLFIELDIRPTLLGRLVTMAFKPDPLYIHLELEDGSKRSYRLISGMARAGFVLSPLIENTDEFGMLYGDTAYLSPKRVRAFSIGPHRGTSRLWETVYSVSFNTLHLPAPVDLSAIYAFDVVDTALPGTQPIQTGHCVGSIDRINNLSPAPDTLTVNGLLQANGWLALSVDPPVVADAVYVVLTDLHGHSTYIRTRQTVRADVAAYFKHPELNRVGYQVLADISALKGTFTLNFAALHSGSIIQCSGLQTITLNK